MSRIQRRELPASGSLLERLYQARHQTWKGAETFSLKSLLPPLLKGLEEACTILQQAWEQQRKVLIVGDFDVDGATSTTLCLDVLGKLGMQVDYLVPNRFDHGYGLTPSIVQVALDEKAPDLIITVDNGIASFEGVAAAKAAGVQVIITDHHLAADALPEADAIINPNQPDCPFPSKAAAGCTVAFYLCLAFVRHLQQQNLLENPPNVLDTLDLVALATIADVVPLDENNRILVEQGLRRIRAGKARPGIYALIQVAKKTFSRLTSMDLGFALGPRINAAGRLDDISTGIECLRTADYDNALAAAQLLNDFNQGRRQVEANMKQQAEAIVERLKVQSERLPKGLCLYDPSWHQGVVGLVASRIKEKYHRPVIAFAPSGNTGEIKGSARSIPGLHIRDTLDLIAKRKPELLQKFGGHAMAAGLSLEESQLPAFMVAFQQAVTESADEGIFEASIQTDGELKIEDFTLENAWSLKLSSPWGQGFPTPLFDGVFEVEHFQVLNNQHLKLDLKYPETQTRLSAIQFNAAVEEWPKLAETPLRVAFQLDVNEFRQQENIQLLIRYLEPAVEQAEA